MKKIVALALSAAMAASLAACGGSSTPATTAAPAATTAAPAATEAATTAAETAAETEKAETPEAPVEKISLKVSHARPVDTDSDIYTHTFLENLENDLGSDRIEYTIYPNNELGDYTLVQESVSMGDVDMCMQSVSTDVDQSLTIATAPYLVENWEQAYQLYNTETGLVSKYVASALEKQNIKLLAMIPRYFNAICLTKEPEDIHDLFGNKGIKVRVPTMKSYELVAQTLGYQATPMPWSDVFTSMQTGIIEGCFGGGPEAFYTQLKDVMKVLVLYRNAFEPHWLMMNMDDWNKFTPEEQEIIMKRARELEDDVFKTAEENDAATIQKFRDEGFTVIDFTDEEIAEISAKVRAEVWPQLEEVFDKETFDAVKKELGIE